MPLRCCVTLLDLIQKSYPGLSFEDAQLLTISDRCEAVARGRRVPVVADHLAYVRSGFVMECYGEPCGSGQWSLFLGTQLFMNPGAYFGTSDPDIEALTRTRVQYIPLEAVRAVCRRSSYLTTVLQGGIIAQRDRLASSLAMTGQSVEARFTQVLAEMVMTIGLRDEDGVFVPIKINRTQLAQMVGCRTETAIRAWRSCADGGQIIERLEGFVIPHDSCFMDLLEKRSVA